MCLKNWLFCAVMALVVGMGWFAPSVGFAAAVEPCCTPPPPPPPPTRKLGVKVATIYQSASVVQTLDPTFDDESETVTGVTVTPRGFERGERFTMIFDVGNDLDGNWEVTRNQQEIPGLEGFVYESLYEFPLVELSMSVFIFQGDRAHRIIVPIINGRARLQYEFSGRGEATLWFALKGWSRDDYGSVTKIPLRLTTRCASCGVWAEGYIGPDTGPKYFVVDTKNLAPFSYQLINLIGAGGKG